MLYILILFLNLFVFTNATCPNGSVPHKTQCLYFQATKSEYFVAESVCNDFGGHLVSIHRLDDNMVISQLAGARFTESSESDFWFGATDVYSPSKWSWLDNSSFDFTNWDKGQPTVTDGSDCGAVIMRGGKWKADDCYNDKPYVCAVAASDASTPPIVTTTTTTTTTTPATTTKPKTCPTSWTYYSLSGYCYKVLENDNWITAENWCKVDNAHLASIHSAEEALFVANFAYYTGADLTNGYNNALIGLYTEDDNAHWLWTDGTPFDFPNWAPTQPDNPEREHCSNIYLSSESYWKAGQLNNLQCNVSVTYLYVLLYQFPFIIVWHYVLFRQPHLSYISLACPFFLALSLYFLYVLYVCCSLLFLLFVLVLINNIIISGRSGCESVGIG